MSAAAAGGFRHEAMFYAGDVEFAAQAVPFIREGLARHEPVLVVESRAKIDLLRAALGADADAVTFADMGQVGANPARIIPVWRAFVDANPGSASLRGIGEPIWKGRSEDELAECQRHEALLNVAFSAGRPWWLLCPYDTSQLDHAVIAEAERSHEYLAHGVGSSAASGGYRGLDACAAPFDAALPEPGPGRRITFDTHRLVKLRAEVVRFATAAGVSIPRARRFVTAVNEVATNSIVHGGGGGSLRLWSTASEVIAEVADGGTYDAPLADRVRPGTRISDARGLWLANELCDLVQIRAVPLGTVVRLHLRIDFNPGRD